MRSPRVFILWLVLLSLPAQGVASLLVGLFGTSHQHPQVAQVEPRSPELHDFRRLAYGGQAATRAHGHSLWSRHHHSTADSTVVALDASAQDPAGDAAGSSAAQLTLCTPAACTTCVAAAGATCGAWPDYRGQAWDGPAAPPLERPPKA